MKSISLIVIALLLVASLASAAPGDSAKYSIKFTRTWTEKTHPVEYPEAGLVTGPHFSGLIGATHNGAYRIFKEGMKPTRGLEKLAEEGKHSPLDDEIKAQIAAGKAGELFETGPIRDAAKMETVEVTVTKKFPLVSAVAMIAPSPDWFAGAMDVNLMENGKWVATKTVDLWAWDAGSDNGATYKADDADVSPKNAVMTASPRHFAMQGKAVRVGTLTFTKQ